MKLAMIGHKDFPSRSGGVEVVVYELATRLARLNCQVAVYNRGRRRGENHTRTQGVEVFRCPAPRRSGLNALAASVRLQAMVFVLLACATVFSRFLAVSTIPTRIGNYARDLLANGMPQIVILLFIILVYFIMGMFTDLISMMLLTIPIFHPIIVDVMGYSTYWFGVLIVLLVAIGNITPPVGGGVFMVKGCVNWDKDATISRMFAGVWYFVIALFISVAIIVAFPGIVTFLVDIM